MPRRQRTQSLFVWHAYRGDEQRALIEVARLAHVARPDVDIELLAIPYDAYAAKLENAIPHGHGPDVFIDAHERLASFVARDLIASVPLPDDGRDLEPTALDAVRLRHRVYGIPLATKCVALFLNTALVPTDPETIDDIADWRPTLPRGVSPLVYEATSAYVHAAFLHAHGGALFDARTGRYAFIGGAAERSVAHVQRWLREGVVPQEASGSLVTQLFASGRAAAAISGPWLAGDLSRALSYRVVPLPSLRATRASLRPFATVETAYVSSRAQQPQTARWFAHFLASRSAAIVRARLGRQVVATRSAWSDPDLARDSVLVAFRAAASGAIVMPTHPNMRLAFEPANRALRRALRGDVSIPEALTQGARRFDDATRPLPTRRSPLYALLALGAVAIALCFAALRRLRTAAFRRELRASLPAYRYVAHAVVAIVLLVIAPLTMGAATSLFAGRDGALSFVGLANYWDILRARGGPLFASGSFYAVLGVTVLWTVANITLHVVLGVALALLLSRPAMRLRGLYRVLLIVPWAVPSYVTALAWKGMFHRQLGAINAVVTQLGGRPVEWFSQFSTAFAANLATNVWLGFPFMMVVALGILSTIPRDLYEAADVDGASAWQRFRHVTWPLLRPAMAPAVAMGAVWTFNMFNVIFLVSGGEPDGETEILVTEAYRWAFTRQAQYGYAAAYAVLIFGILALGARGMSRAGEATR